MTSQLLQGGVVVASSAAPYDGRGSLSPPDNKPGLMGSQPQPGSSPTHPSCEVLGVSPTKDVELAFAQLHSHGFCILADVLTAADLQTLLPMAVGAAQAHDSETFRGAWHLPGFIRHPETHPFAPHVANPRVLALAQRALGTEELRVAFSTLQINKPRCGQAGWHTDGHLSQGGQSLYDSSAASADEGNVMSQLQRPIVVNVMFMLTEFTRENGGTWLVPGSHMMNTENEPQLWADEGRYLPRQDAVHVVGPAGAACMFDCRIHHCLPPNHTDSIRAMGNVRCEFRYAANSYVTSCDGSCLRTILQCAVCCVMYVCCPSQTSRRGHRLTWCCTVARTRQVSHRGRHCHSRFATPCHRVCGRSTSTPPNCHRACLLCTMRNLATWV